MARFGQNALAIYCCGAECGLAAAGTASNGVEHLTQVGAFASVVTSGPPMRSPRCWYFNGASAIGSLNAHTFATAIASPATAVARFYVWFNSLPDVDCELLNFTSTSTLNVRFIASDGTIRAHTAASGITVTTGRWYRIDAKAVFATTRTVDVQVNGVAATQYSAAGSSATCTGISYGAGIGVSGTYSHYIDDLCVSGTSADYPIGAGLVVPMYPNADGTHNRSADGDFGKGASAATPVTAGSTDCWQSLANPLSTSIGTNFLGAIAAGSTEYLEIAFDFPAPMSPGMTILTAKYFANGVMMVLTTHSASATTNNLTVTPRDGTGGLTGGAITADLSESTNTAPCKMYNYNAGGAPFIISEGDLEGLNVRFSSTDVTPDVYLDGVMFEVDIVQPSWQLPLRGVKPRQSQALLIRGGF